jgi:serine palmitoyltransferase
MELDALQSQLGELAQQASVNFQKVPGSAVLMRYIQSSYQNDPVRSAIELVLVIFFIRYLLSPSYPTDKSNYVKLREDVCPLFKVSYCGSASSDSLTLAQEIDELVNDWTPEPLVGEQLQVEAIEAEKLPVIVG